MTRAFTLAEAQMLLPVLDGLLRRAKKAAARAEEMEAEMRDLGQKIFLAGGMHVDVAAAARRRAQREKALEEAKETLAEIDAIGVQVQDLEKGLLDFPCYVEGKIVLLCWRLGEPSIIYWHKTGEGFARRQPVDARFGKTERERLN